jgi:hypothetical protein
VFTSGVFADAPSGDLGSATANTTAGAQLERAGQFSDTFGWVSTTFSALAFAGILYTLHLQRADLKLQRKEMRAARKEATRTADSASRSSVLSALAALWQHYEAMDSPENKRQSRARITATKIEIARMIHVVMLSATLDVKARRDINARTEAQIQSCLSHIRKIREWMPTEALDESSVRHLFHGSQTVAESVCRLVGSVGLYIPAGSTGFAVVDEITSLAEVQSLPLHEWMSDFSKKPLAEGAARKEFDEWFQRIEGLLADLDLTSRLPDEEESDQAGT